MFWESNNDDDLIFIWGVSRGVKIKPSSKIKTSITRVGPGNIIRTRNGGSVFDDYIGMRRLNFMFAKV